MCASEALIERGWSVEIITARWNPDAFEGRLDRFKPRLVPRPCAGPAGGIDRRSLSAIADAIRDCDIAMAHNYQFNTYLGFAPVALPKVWYCQEPYRRIHAQETSPGLHRGIAPGNLDPDVPGNRELARALRVSQWMRQVHVVVFAVHFHQRGVRVRADVGEDAAQEVDSLCVEHTAAILCYEDQMHVQLENAVSAVLDIAFIAHRPAVS
jgi:hypothetical protein